MEKAVKYLLGYTWVPSSFPSQWVWKLQEESPNGCLREA